MLAEPIGVSPEGCLVAGERPGLGVDLDEEALRRYQVS
jgi:L-alanine-DL-glutamate epimerase-like enolase superfamily enzyme